jgi:hypothetical protein
MMMKMMMMIIIRIIIILIIIIRNQRYTRIAINVYVIFSKTKKITSKQAYLF